MKKTERDELQALLKKLDPALKPEAINTPYWYNILKKIQSLMDEEYQRGYDDYDKSIEGNWE